ncbi:MAG: MlaD family protein [Elusimicrobiota bacterium]|jgi:phospholipid/cholesterol/gamma-HCH transport system substrate-binding protein
MSNEARVGAFVLAGMALLATGIFLLGDFTFERRYTVQATFSDVSGLAEDSQVKLSGVEVGKVGRMRFNDGKVYVEARIRHGVPIYRDAVFSVGSTGIIGSKFLQIDQGHAAAGMLEGGDTVTGVDPVSIEKALAQTLASLQNLLGGLNGEAKPGTLAANLNASVEHVRSLTANLDEMFGDIKPELTSAMQRMDSVAQKLDSLLTRTDRIMANLDEGKGPMGALISDEKMRADVKGTVSDLRETVGNVKDMVGRINQFKVYWNYDWRYDHAIRGSHGDIGLRIEPREGRYYYAGGSNLGNDSDVSRRTDYQRKNRVDALLGFGWGGVDLGVGVLRSAGGGRLTWTPMKGDPLWGRFSVMGQAYDFGRNRVIEGRTFNKPQFDAGALARLHRLVGVGARVEDIAEVPRYQTWVNVNFEDKDIAYLFGMVSFGAAGSKGRSKSK